MGSFDEGGLGQSVHDNDHVAASSLRLAAAVAMVVVLGAVGDFSARPPRPRRSWWGCR